MYKRSDKNKWTVWNVWVVQESPKKSIIKRGYGQENGKITETTKEITKGKNIGKSNETTVLQQACNEARSLFNKQKDTNHYSESKTIATESVSPPPNPMLAHSYEKHSKKVRFPCYVQPKLDGVRMLCDTKRCFSRTGKAFDAVPMRRITDALCRLDPGLLKDVAWFDGELFSTELMFEDIVGACRTSVVHDESKHTQLQYHVYDIVTKNTKLDYEARYKILQNIAFDSSVVRLVPCEQAVSEDDVYRAHDRYVSERYEGIMIRNKSGGYKPSRSYDLQKYKCFVDHEFEITDVKEAVGNDAGTAILRCKTNESSFFWVRPKGSREYRASLLSNARCIVGKTLTVRYQNLTDKGVPRFPVGVAIRDYE